MDLILLVTNLMGSRNGSPENYVGFFSLSSTWYLSLSFTWDLVLGTGTWYFLAPVLSLLCLSSSSPLLLLPSIASVIIMVKVEMVKGGKWENDKSDSHNA